MMKIYKNNFYHDKNFNAVGLVVFLLITVLTTTFGCGERQIRLERICDNNFQGTFIGYLYSHMIDLPIPHNSTYTDGDPYYPMFLLDNKLTIYDGIVNADIIMEVEIPGEIIDLHVNNKYTDDYHTRQHINILSDVNGRKLLFTYGMPSIDRETEDIIYDRFDVSSKHKVLKPPIMPLNKEMMEYECSKFSLMSKSETDIDDIVGALEENIVIGYRQSDYSIIKIDKDHSENVSFSMNRPFRYALAINTIYLCDGKEITLLDSKGLEVRKIISLKQQTGIENIHFEDTSYDPASRIIDVSLKCADYVYFFKARSGNIKSIIDVSKNGRYLYSNGKFILFESEILFINEDGTTKRVKLDEKYSIVRSIKHGLQSATQLDYFIISNDTSECIASKTIWISSNYSVLDKKRTGYYIIKIDVIPDIINDIIGGYKLTIFDDGAFAYALSENGIYKIDINFSLRREMRFIPINMSLDSF